MQFLPTEFSNEPQPTNLRCLDFRLAWKFEIMKYMVFLLVA